MCLCVRVSSENGQLYVWGNNHYGQLGVLVRHRQACMQRPLYWFVPTVTFRTEQRSGGDSFSAAEQGKQVTVYKIPHTVYIIVYLLCDNAHTHTQNALSPTVAYFR